MTRNALVTLVLLASTVLGMGQTDGANAWVSVRAADDDLQALADSLEKRAPELIESAAARLQLPVQTRVEIILARRVPQTDQERQELGVGHVPAWAGGLAQPERGRIVLFVDRASVYPHNDLAGLLAHEACHWLLGSQVPDDRAVPRWYHEGLAMTCERAASFEDAWRLARQFTLARPIPLEDLTRGWPREAGPARAAYAQSFSMVSLARANAAPGAERRLVENLQRGDEFTRAFSAAYGVHPQTLHDRWKSTLRFRYVVLPVTVLVTVANGLMGLLALWGYRRVRRRRRAQLEKMALEDARTWPDDTLN